MGMVETDTAAQPVDLKTARQRATLTLEALADLSGVSASQIQRLETGANVPLLDTAEALERALGCRLAFPKRTRSAVA